LVERDTERSAGLYKRRRLPGIAEGRALMPRTIVHATGDLGAAGGPPDGYFEKLTKYVPAEALAAFLALQAAATGSNDLQWAALVVGAVATAAYLYIYNKQKKIAAPKWWYVGLSVVAFVVWAFGTNAPTRALLNVNDVSAHFILVAGTFGIPLVDQALS
jgi:hypothetical protein